jgi:hypothetical protein
MKQIQNQKSIWTNFVKSLQKFREQQNKALENNKNLENNTTKQNKTFKKTSCYLHSFMEMVQFNYNRVKKCLCLWIISEAVIKTLLLHILK